MEDAKCRLPRVGTEIRWQPIWKAPPSSPQAQRCTQKLRNWVVCNKMRQCRWQNDHPDTGMHSGRCRIIVKRENQVLTPFSRLSSAFLDSPYSLATLQGARKGRGESWFGWINFLLLFSSSYSSSSFFFSSSRSMIFGGCQRRWWQHRAPHPIRCLLLSRADGLCELRMWRLGCYVWVWGGCECGASDLSPTHTLPGLSFSSIARAPSAGHLASLLSFASKLEQVTETVLVSASGTQQEMMCDSWRASLLPEYTCAVGMSLMSRPMKHTATKLSYQSKLGLIPDVWRAN